MGTPKSTRTHKDTKPKPNGAAKPAAKPKPTPAGYWRAPTHGLAWPCEPGPHELRRVALQELRGALVDVDKIPGPGGGGVAALVVLVDGPTVVRDLGTLARVTVQRGTAVRVADVSLEKFARLLGGTDAHPHLIIQAIHAPHGLRFLVDVSEQPVPASSYAEPAPGGAAAAPAHS